VWCAQILIGNKCDIDESKRQVPVSKGQALADEFGLPFFETSAKVRRPQRGGFALVGSRRGGELRLHLQRAEGGVHSTHFALASVRWSEAESESNTRHRRAGTRTKAQRRRRRRSPNST
jgi:hypothetical protein